MRDTKDNDRVLLGSTALLCRKIAFVFIASSCVIRLSLFYFLNRAGQVELIFIALCSRKSVRFS